LSRKKEGKKTDGNEFRESELEGYSTPDGEDSEEPFSDVLFNNATDVVIMKVVDEDEHGGELMKIVNYSMLICLTLFW